MNINECPYCKSTDLEAVEVSTTEYAVFCFECRANGPICGSEDEAIAKHNAATSTPVPNADLFNDLKEVA